MKENNFVILAKEWFEKGNHDLDEAKLSHEHGGWTDIICFHCQQAAEKYLACSVRKSVKQNLQ